MPSPRLSVRKTYKLYVGGKFVRGESGRHVTAEAADGTALDNCCRASRKDFRDAVVAARAAQAGWAKATPYLRGQILYRAAEMLEPRAGQLSAEIQRSTGAGPARAQAEVAAAIDRLVYYAGWADKYAQVLGSVNPVASPHFNFTTPEPTGVVAVFAPARPSLAALVSLLAPVIVSGNATVALVSERFPLPALTFAEILATSDLPGGVVNLLSGPQAELAPHVAGHLDVNAIVDGSGQAALGPVLRGGAAVNLKRCTTRDLSPDAWLGEATEDPGWILDTVELKTAWHPIGL
ncbi:MAG: hypothetical protein RJA22_2394 [Verrucomicrobiota bacterium]|jgi:acyl-CoA reductase-like NAD-dependent aldehyde dehydrogenase